MMTTSEKDSSEVLLTSDEEDEDCDELSCMAALDTILPMDSRFSRLSFQSANSRRLYRRRVSFEHTKSYTLRTTSQGYCHNSQSRLFMIIADDDEVVSSPGDSVGSTGATPSNHTRCVNNNNTAAAAAACGLIRYTMVSCHADVIRVRQAMYVCILTSLRTLSCFIGGACERRRRDCGPWFCPRQVIKRQPSDIYINGPITPLTWTIIMQQNPIARKTSLLTC